jgi:Rieske Fe-S protein
MSEIDPLPAAPELPAAPPDRRGFLTWFTTGVYGLAAAAVGVPLGGYLLGSLRKRPAKWVALGPVGKFPLNQTRRETFTNPIRQPWDGMAADTACFVRYLGRDDQEQDQFWVFAVNCTHLGCPVTWSPQAGLFLCPCHGGVYYENGDRASGPPPRGLYRYVWRVRDGQLEIQAPHLPTLQDPLDRQTELVQLGVQVRRPECDSA